jgi:hypothetical protein
MQSRGGIGATGGCVMKFLGGGFSGWLSCNETHAALRPLK